MAKSQKRAPGVGCPLKYRDIEDRLNNFHHQIRRRLLEGDINKGIYGITQIENSVTDVAVVKTDVAALKTSNKQVNKKFQMQIIKLEN